MRTRRLSILALLLALMLAFSACGGSAPASEDKTTETEVVSEPAEETVPETKEEEPPAPKYFSALTGLPVESAEDTNRRPVAIMINNIKKALPQSGISRAGIIFEALAEGGITRLLAVFEDVSDIEQIGTIRSSRPYYLDFAQSVDAIYIHIGASPEAYSEIKKRKMDSFDLIEGGNSDMCWRDKNRIKNNGYEHSVYTSGERIMNKLEKRGTRTELGESYGSVFNFSSDAEYKGTDATKVTARFSNYKTGTYTYDEASGLYRIGQYGQAHVDELYNQQIAFKNIFVLRINSYVIKGDDAGRLRFETTGSGKGMYFVNGTKTDITWKRDGKSSPFKLYLKDGTELPVVPGDSYVAVVPLDAEVTVE